MAVEALQNINGGNVGGYQNEAILRSNGMKEEFGDGISTQILIYNASGYKLNLQASGSHSGKWSNYSAPDFIEVGEWAVCFHQKKAGAAVGSEGYIVFNCVDSPEGVSMRWSTPFIGSNKATTIIGNPVVLSVLGGFKSDFAGKASGSTHKGSLKASYSISDASSALLTYKVTNE